MFSEGIERDQWHEMGSGFILAWISFSITFEGFDIVLTRQYISLLSFILFFWSLSLFQLALEYSEKIFLKQ